LNILKIVKLSNSIVAYYLNENLHPGDILGQVDNSSLIWRFGISLEELAELIFITSKTLAFCKIYVANPRSSLEPSKCTIVHDLRCDETHSGLKIGQTQSLDKLVCHCRWSKITFVKIYNIYKVNNKKRWLHKPFSYKEFEAWDNAGEILLQDPNRQRSHKTIVQHELSFETPGFFWRSLSYSSGDNELVAYVDVKTRHYESHWTEHRLDRYY
jgi:hypothetical protein